jgi:hypothetical protein
MGLTFFFPPIKTLWEVKVPSKWFSLLMAVVTRISPIQGQFLGYSFTDSSGNKNLNYKLIGGLVPEYCFL